MMLGVFSFPPAAGPFLPRSRAEVTLIDSNHKPLLKPVVLEIADTGAGVSVSVKSKSTEPA